MSMNSINGGDDKYFYANGVRLNQEDVKSVKTRSNGTKEVLFKTGIFAVVPQNAKLSNEKDAYMEFYADDMFYADNLNGVKITGGRGNDSISLFSSKNCEINTSGYGSDRIGITKDKGVDSNNRVTAGPEDSLAVIEKERYKGQFIDGKY